MTRAGLPRSAELSRAISLALRHEPWTYELEPDQDGWVDLETLVAGLRTDRWPSVTSADVESLVQSAEKRRHEVAGGRIRALYGHSLATRILHTNGRPPDILFHGTSPAAAVAIQTEGLRPMGRQYVHLSVDIETAREVGKRKARDAIALTVDAAAAHEAGVVFYRGNDRTWLADAVPARYIGPTPSMV